ncbi:MAG: Smr/MutS family protein [PVC group bacterium]|nr:Smr/MutS family protein [PVC group bacterium]
MAKLKLDLHDIFNKGKKIDAELMRVLDEAVEKGIRLIEIIPGKGSGQLKKHVLRFLDQKHIRKMYHRIDKDSKNWGRLFIHLKKQ